MARKPTDTVQLKLRFSEALRRRLEREAARQDRSLNSEIISRVEQSFQKRDESELTGSTLRAAFGGATGDLLRAIAIAIWLIEKRTGKKWNEDSHAGSLASIALHTIEGGFRFPLDAKRIADRIVDYEQHLGRSEASESILAFRAAITALQLMGMAPSDAEIAKETAELRLKVERIRSTVSRISSAASHRR